MNSSTYNYNPINSTYFLLENDMDDDTISTQPNLDPNCCYSSSSYTCTSFFPNSPQKFYSEFDLYEESLHLQHISHHLFSDTEILDNNPHHHLLSSSPSPLVPKPAPKMISSSSNRSSKKDRHSKIKTANGLRDRRMRLSLDVAKRFFNLQDMLGYDKASHTVNWLLKNSFVAIRDLERERLGTNNTSSSTNQNCDVEAAAAGSSGLDALSGTSLENATTAVVKVKTKTKRKLATRATVEKESRTKARERARARTSQKRRLTVRLEETSEMFSSEPAWILPSTAAFGDPTHDLAEIRFPDKPWET